MGKKSNRKKMLREMSNQMSEEQGKHVNLAKLAKVIRRDGDNLFTYYVPDKYNPDGMREVMYNPTKRALNGKGYKSDSGNEVMQSAGAKYKEILRKMKEEQETEDNE